MLEFQPSYRKLTYTMSSEQKLSLDYSNSTGKSCLLCHNFFSNMDKEHQLISVLLDSQEDENTGPVTVAHALSTIFEVSLKDNMIEEDLFVMCKNCAPILNDLYSSFTQLLALANPEGLFRQSFLKDSIFWSNKELKIEEIEDIMKEEFDVVEVQEFPFDMEDSTNFIGFNFNCASGSDDSNNVATKFQTNSGDKKQPKSKSKSRKKIFKCTLCPKIFSQECRLKYHEVRTHSFGDRLEGRTCQFCHKYFLSPTVLKLHEEDVHLSERVLQCSHCPKKFKCTKTLKSHEKFMHSGMPKPPGFSVKKGIRLLPCPQCEKTYKTHGGLKDHIKFNHEKKFDFVCEQCGKTFKRQTQLNLHSEIHSLKRERNFKCTHCGKGFMTKSTLRSHVETHTLEKPHLCSECGARFLHLTGFLRHMLARHSILVKPTPGLAGPFKCEQCGKEFNIKASLSHHLRTKSHGGPGFKSGIKRKSRKKKCKTDDNIDTGGLN